MSYQVIARKYRPQRFADVVGQEHVTQTLGNAIQQSRIAHAYLFVGPRGTGKTTIARIFAKCLNCTGGPKVEFADDDPRVQEITEGRSLDVLEIDGASNRGIEEIRELRDTVKYAPANSRFKIYIIDEVHMLTKEAFNALLKTLEEPPAHVKFMFATTEPEKVLPTILSRCQRFDLRRIPSALIVEHLGQIARLEKIKIDDAALHAIARGAEGGMRDAESTLDQLISFCGDTIAETDVLSMFGLAARNQILQVAQAILEGQAEAALREFNELARSGKDLGRLVTDLLGHLRNLLIYQISRGDMNLLEVSEAEADALKEQSALADSGALTRVMDILTDCETRLRDAASKKILIEVALLKAIQARQAVPIDSVLKRIDELRNENAGATSLATTPNPASAAPRPASVMAPRADRQPGSVAAPQPASDSSLKAEAPAPAPQMASAFAPAETTSLEQIWSNVIERVGLASPFTKTYLLEAHPVSMVKNLFTIGLDPEFSDHFSLVDTPKTRALIETKLQEMGCGGRHVKFILAEAPAGRVRSAPSHPGPSSSANVTPDPAPAPTEAPAEVAKMKIPLSKEDFKNDPLIRQALEIFKGQIVEVRA
jgi:DNA polymerase III subunit gamma/tau